MLAGSVAVTVPLIVEFVTISPAPAATVTCPFWVAPVRQVVPLATVSCVGWLPVIVVVQVVAAGFTWIDSAWVTLAGVASESVALTVKSEVPDDVGVPEITPLVLSDRPVGSAPEATDHE